MATKKESKKSENGSRLATALPYLLLVGGIIATIASVALSVEVFTRLKNPDYVPVCNLNPILSCTNVADSAQAHIFGFPNYFIGIAGYAAVTTIGAVMLAGAKMSRRFWQLTQAGLTFAIIFITWLQFQTLYRIGALCLFCMIVWACTIPMFWYATLYNIQEGHIKLPSQLNATGRFIRKYHAEILAAWFLIIILLILKRFWYYWSTL